ncbi:MAG: homoserine O-acetyltransferase [Bacteroidetes bacterium]|nr:MAG: homoserine O-acetyltransferase [Bacteroidota bacterium]
MIDAHAQENLQIFHHNEPFVLESGEVLPAFQLGYSTVGKLNEARDNAVWICHALTANTDAVDWWGGVVGKGCLFNPDEHVIVCANMLGSCYGSTNALSINPLTQKPYYHTFPMLTNRDMARAFDLLREHLGISRIAWTCGGSMGGQHIVEWNILRPEVFENIFLIATNAQHSAWGIAFNESQRMAIEADSTWHTDSPTAGKQGLGAARAMALLSYRNYAVYTRTQSEPSLDNFDNFRAISYQHHQAQKLQNRFHAFSYWTLSKAMDSQNVGRGRQSVANALASIRAKAYIIGISSDILFPPSEQRLLAEHIPQARYFEIDSDLGHDGFLIEAGKITEILQPFVRPK